MITTISATSIHEPAHYIAERIAEQLTQGRSVLWLISGGSCINVAAAGAKILTEADVPLENLTVSLVDERYGQPGHPDSNWTQLMASGFEAPGAWLYPVLPGSTRAAAAHSFEEFLDAQLKSSDYRLGLFGIGSDGHTSGILPHSPAVMAQGLVTHYDGADYERISTTQAAIHTLDEAVLYAQGKTKWPQLARLDEDLTVAEHPAQTLKLVPVLKIFSDRPLADSKS